MIDTFVQLFLNIVHEQQVFGWISVFYRLR